MFFSKKKGMTVMVRNQKGVLVVKATGKGATAVMDLLLPATVTIDNPFISSGNNRKSFKFVEESNITVLKELLVHVSEGYYMTIDND